MSIKINEYGVKIKNIEAGTLFEFSNGVRDHYEYKNALFVNSLFKDFLLENGMKLWNEESTRDLICLEFNYGSRSYQDEMRHMRKIAYNAMQEFMRAKIHNDQYLIDVAFNKRKKIIGLIKTAHENKDKYFPLSTEQLRELYYISGVDVEYLTRKKDGTIKKREIIHYKMLYRSTGKAKKGSCMFIRESLYEKALNFLRMGITLDDNSPMIVEISAYSPLVSSGIVGKIKINPKNVLILKDVERFFDTQVISVETDECKHCIAKYIEKYKLKNTLFDGQALIDNSIFPSWGNGYILLRHHFCKMAAFNTNIQKFFKDYFGEQYASATVQDMFGNIHYVKDIELITTDNAMKWIKFGKTYDYWCSWVYDNNCMFGIVKTAHESKLGSLQRMSYQMVNSLDEDIMSNVTRESVNYINELKNDINTFIDYLKKNNNFSNDYEVLIALYENVPDFERSSYFRERRKKIIESYILQFKSGKIIQNAENLTVVGSPYAMLLYAATGNEASVDDDDTFFCEEGTIQCYTERFNSRENLAFFRSPFNSKNNLMYLHNIYHVKLEKYFNFGKQVIAINMNGTDAQDRSNGMDQDSDFGYTTNQPSIVSHAKSCYLEYPTIVNNIKKDSQVYENNMASYARVDNGLSKSQTDIGESSNLAQIAQTYACSFNDKKYNDYVCILSVLAQVAIDNAKRRFDVDLSEEIKRIKINLDVKTNKYPKFWRIIKRGFNKDNINNNLHCPMNYLCELELLNFKYKDKTIPIGDFFQKYVPESNKRKNKKIENLIEKYSLKLFEYNVGEVDSEEYLLLRSDFDELIREIQGIHISGNYVGLMSWLIDRAFNITPDVNRNKLLKSKLSKNKSLLLKVLYSVSRDNLIKCFSKK